MEQLIAGKILNKRKVAQRTAQKDVRARMMTIGGTLILAIIIILTLVFALNLLFPRGNGVQFVIITALSVIGWGFFLNCVSEHLKLDDGYLEFSSLIGRTIKISLQDIISYKLTDYGVRLDGNMYLLEVTHSKKSKPEEIWLSPCWNNKELSAFCVALDNALDEFDQ